MSKECKDLLKKILSPIRNRATIDDILADPWIISHTMVETEIKDNMMVDTNQPEKDLENAIIT